MNEPDLQNEIILTGISGSPGICIGQAYLVDKEGVNVVEKYPVLEENLENEIIRFKTAVKKTRDELTEIINSLPDDLSQHINILESHMALSNDKMLYEKTIEEIESRKINAEWALKVIVTNIKEMFKSIPDPYLQSRSADIVQVSDKIMRNLVGADALSISSINKRVILVANDLTPADTSQIQLEKIMGFVTDRGGKTSHTSIIARTLEIPSIQGLGSATKKIKNEDIIIVDGNDGVLIIHPSDETLLKYRDKRLNYELYKADINRLSSNPAETIDGCSIKLNGNIELAEEIVSVLDYGGEGVGLYRTEFQYLSRNSFPDEEELFEGYKSVAELMAPGSVTIRTLDINGDKALSYNDDTDLEMNPALGLRAIRFCLNRPDVFVTQLRAIMRAALYGNIEVMFPMISGVEEVIETKELMQQASDDLAREGIPHNSDIKIGVMIEIPSAVVMADALADEVDFFSIGTNDLTQYLLAIDRGNRKVAYLYNSLHPAVLQMVNHVVKVGEKKNVAVCMCGEMASDPLNMPVLIGLGLKEFSMTPQSIPAVKDTIRKINKKDSCDIAKKALKMKTTKEIIQLTKDAGASLSV